MWGMGCRAGELSGHALAVPAHAGEGAPSRLLCPAARRRGRGGGEWGRTCTEDTGGAGSVDVGWKGGMR